MRICDQMFDARTRILLLNVVSLLTINNRHL